MKHLGTILAAIAIIGVIYVGFLREDQIVAKKNTNISNPDKGVRMAYVRTDSLQKQYKYFQELNEELLKEEEKVQKEIEKKQRDFQYEVQLYQESAPKMNPQDRQKHEADLMRVQQQYEMWANEQSNILMEKQQELQTKMKSDMDSVLVRMKDELALDFILLYDENSALIFANPDYDITEVVVEKLNENYAKKASEAIEE